MQDIFKKAYNCVLIIVSRYVLYFKREAYMNNGEEIIEKKYMVII
jgi:hypothetical protein